MITNFFHYTEKQSPHYFSKKNLPWFILEYQLFCLLNSEHQVQESTAYKSQLFSLISSFQKTHYKNLQKKFLYDLLSFLHFFLSSDNPVEKDPEYLYSVSQHFEEHEQYLLKNIHPEYHYGLTQLKLLIHLFQQHYSLSTKTPLDIKEHDHQNHQDPISFYFLSCSSPDVLKGLYQNLLPILPHSYLNNPVIQSLISWCEQYCLHHDNPLLTSDWDLLEKRFRNLYLSLKHFPSIHHHFFIPLFIKIVSLKKIPKLPPLTSYFLNDFYKKNHFTFFSPSLLLSYTYHTSQYPHLWRGYFEQQHHSSLQEYLLCSITNLDSIKKNHPTGLPLEFFHSFFKDIIPLFQKEPSTFIRSFQTSLDELNRREILSKNLFYKYFIYFDYFDFIQGHRFFQKLSTQQQQEYHIQTTISLHTHLEWLCLLSLFSGKEDFLQNYNFSTCSIYTHHDQNTDFWFHYLLTFIFLHYSHKISESDFSTSHIPRLLQILPPFQREKIQYLALSKKKKFFSVSSFSHTSIHDLCEHILSGHSIDTLLSFFYPENHFPSFQNHFQLNKPLSTTQKEFSIQHTSTLFSPHFYASHMQDHESESWYLALLEYFIQESLLSAHLFNPLFPWSTLKIYWESFWIKFFEEYKMILIKSITTVNSDHFILLQQQLNDFYQKGPFHHHHHFSHHLKTKIQAFKKIIYSHPPLEKDSQYSLDFINNT